MLIFMHRRDFISILWSIFGSVLLMLKGLGIIVGAKTVTLYEKPLD